MRYAIQGVTSTESLHHKPEHLIRLNPYTPIPRSLGYRLQLANKTDDSTDTGTGCRNVQDPPDSVPTYSLTYCRHTVSAPPYSFTYDHTTYVQPTGCYSFTISGTGCRGVQDPTDSVPTRSPKSCHTASNKPSYSVSLLLSQRQPDKATLVI
ncbi:hypothetical protein PCANC_14185 [Puccinia coronata f. sp. avenae]|uniref:Uncharacterized protein n=1 Tax=Puccinia coronata f. sp. avenae TaxID=200324 RepID=A0A2N5UK36_9BASI|nr:hypothetical protein PCANC_14185 [Puccinia coronata f. sp. avenae]